MNMEAAWLGRRSGAKDPDDWNRRKAGAVEWRNQIVNSLHWLGHVVVNHEDLLGEHHLWC